MRELVGLDELKDYLGSDALGNITDNFLSGLIRSASSHIIRECRKSLILKEQTEYYSGNGLNILRLKNYPIFKPSEIDIRVDGNYVFGDDTKLAYSTLSVDNKAGLVFLLDGTFTEGTKNIKVIYTAGYSNFTILKDVNDNIDFSESGSKNAVISPGDYNADDLATEIQSKMNNAGSYNYTVTYDKISQKFNITATDTFGLLFSGGVNSSKAIYKLIGFKNEDKSGSKYYISDYTRSGVPEDLKRATLAFSEKLFNDSKLGDARAGIRSTNVGNDFNVQYMIDAVPPYVNTVIKGYKKIA